MVIKAGDAVTLPATDVLTDAVKIEITVAQIEAATSITFPGLDPIKKQAKAN